MAGFDGYSHDERENYGESSMAFVTRSAVLDAMNRGMIEGLEKCCKNGQKLSFFDIAEICNLDISSIR
ncbi:MAG: hypothetical protein L6V93_05355 [Clostridiales bacterium]|nr:MAG: hypothetical protein L6V93_05355 [Clostridiales bacterium]